MDRKAFGGRVRKLSGGRTAFGAAAMLLIAVPPAVAATLQPVPNIAPHCVYVTNEMSGDLTLIDGARLEPVATIPLGKRPRGLQVAKDGKTLYVALSGSPIAGPGVDESKLPPPDKSADGIGVVRTEDRVLTRVLRGVSDPEQLAVDLAGERVFVASEDTSSTVVLRTKDGATLANLAVGGEPEGVDLSPDGRHVYVSSESDRRVTVIDTRTLEAIAQVPVGERPRAIAFAPDGRRAYVTGENDASVTVIDTQRHAATATLKLEGENVRPMGVVVSPDARTVFVATGRGGTVVAIDTGTLEPRASLHVGQRPWGIALSPDGRQLYTANGPSNDVTVVDVAAWKVIGTLAAGDRPWGVAVGPACGAPAAATASNAAVSTAAPDSRSR
jgi:YVTN family beta-propeller protein